MTDITEHWTSEGTLHVCVKRRVLKPDRGIRKRPEDESFSCCQSAENVLMHRGLPEGVIVHSDRGSQFRSKKFQKALKRHKLLGSMGRVGAAGDNAAMESFFALLQKNVFDRKSWATRRELRLAVVAWVEGKYHRKRRQRRLGKLTSIEFEAITMNAVALAA